MQSRPLVIVTTRLPPQICGVGTFSWLLRRHWPDTPSTQRFLVIDAGDKSSAEQGEESITEFGYDWKALGRLLEQEPGSDVLLHYAGRAYHPLGCPAGLVSALQRWKRKCPEARLVIFFHELPGGLPITSRHFWVNFVSRRIAGKLAKLADLLITNTPDHARTLEKISGQKNVQWLPVPSNIENTTEKQVNRTPTEFVIFGLPYGRWQTLQMFDAELRAWQKSGVLTKLHLIGPGDDKFDFHSQTLLKSYPKPDVIVQHGEMSAREISRLLSGTQFALIMANESTWSKSATFMAFLAHGCVVVMRSKSNIEPLSAVIVPEQVGVVPNGELQARSEAGRTWYETNADWKVLAGKMADLIANLP